MLHILNGTAENIDPNVESLHIESSIVNIETLLQLPKLKTLKLSSLRPRFDLKELSRITTLNTLQLVRCPVRVIDLDIDNLGIFFIPKPIISISGNIKFLNISLADSIGCLNLPELTSICLSNVKIFRGISELPKLESVVMDTVWELTDDDYTELNLMKLESLSIMAANIDANKFNINALSAINREEYKPILMNKLRLLKRAKN
jgi:hypothetical protein